MTSWAFFQTDICSKDIVRVIPTYLMIRGAEFPRETAFQIRDKAKRQRGHIYSFLWALDLSLAVYLKKKKNWVNWTLLEFKMSAKDMIKRMKRQAIV